MWWRTNSEYRVLSIVAVVVTRFISMEIFFLTTIQNPPHKTTPPFYSPSIAAFARFPIFFSWSFLRALRSYQPSFWIWCLSGDYYQISRTKIPIRHWPQYDANDQWLFFIRWRLQTCPGHWLSVIRIRFVIGSIRTFECVSLNFQGPHSIFVRGRHLFPADR